MKDLIRPVILIVTFITIMFALLFWGVSDETVKAIFALAWLGAFVASAFITGCLAMFVHWLSQTNTEQKSGDNSVDEKAS